MFGVAGDSWFFDNFVSVFAEYETWIWWQWLVFFSFTLFTDFALSVAGILWWLNLNLAVRGHGNNSAAGIHGCDLQNSEATLQSDVTQGGLPTPASLAEVILSTRQILIEQAAEDLSVCTFKNLIHMV